MLCLSNPPPPTVRLGINQKWTDWSRFAAVAYDILSSEEDDDAADAASDPDTAGFANSDLYDGF
jgi:hypothetical protein